MGKKRQDRIAVTESSGNVFADLGLAEPEEELAKARLANHIRRAIERRRLNQVAAAALMGIDQPKVSALINGRIDNFSSERLMRYSRPQRDACVARSSRPNGLLWSTAGCGTPRIRGVRASASLKRSQRSADRDPGPLDPRRSRLGLIEV